MTWDFIYSGGLDVAYLSFAEIDQHGNVNVSMYGDRMNGCGDSLILAKQLRELYFQGRWCRSQSTCSNNELVIEQEGHTKKFVEQVKNLDFNAAYSRKLGQEVYYVTERAVFN